MGVGLGSPCCTAVTLTTSAPRLLPNPVLNSSHHPLFPPGLNFGLGTVIELEARYLPCCISFNFSLERNRKVLFQDLPKHF